MTTYKRKGFATLPPEVRRELGSRGGKTTHALGKGKVWDSESASRAGKLSAEKRRFSKLKPPPIPAEILSSEIRDEIDAIEDFLHTELGQDEVEPTNSEAKFTSRSSG